MTSYLPGDVVKTAYGIGVVIALPSSNGLPSFYQVSLWRLPGKSVGSSSTAYLNQDALLGTLPVAPGMTSFRLQGERKEEVMVHAFHENSQTYLVSPAKVDEEDSSAPTQLIEVPSDEMEKAPSAKFYPLLHDLMRRG